ncbi:toprim domain-containing protein [Spirosoma spitsbergense]|uniref:toprim domain-containing protein n=1 Tax=Spirosoma spitsbergense TaxID=431554 RepID=UPI00037BD3DE|nr:toprim domain-containing protein [Spirosoma spitsbergense]
MTKFDELKKRFPNLIPVQELRSNVSIIELAIHYGYSLKLDKGKARPVLENVAHNDVILIKNAQNASQQVYQRVGNFTDSGTIINFIRNRLATVFSKFNRSGEDEFKNIVSVLYDYLRIDPEQVDLNRRATEQLVERKLKPLFSLDLFELRPLENDNYLKTRHISLETINSLEFINRIATQITYFDPQKHQIVDFNAVKDNPQQNYILFSNVAFPYYDGVSTEVTGLEIRNENVKLHAPGSDKTSSVFVSNLPPKAEQFFILESAIDALSHKQLRSLHGDTKFNSVYFSTGGHITPEQVNSITQYINTSTKAPAWKINLAFDNDAKGYLYDLQFIQQLLVTKFPLRSVSVGQYMIGLALPTQETYRAFREDLLDRIEAYNEMILSQRTLSFSTNTTESTNLLISINQTTDQIMLSLPETNLPLSYFTKSLLELSGLNKRICINKSTTKDFNQDLQQEILTTSDMGN